MTIKTLSHVRAEQRDRELWGLEKEFWDRSMDMECDLSLVAKVLKPLLEGPGVQLPCACLNATCPRCQLELIVARYWRE